MRAISLDDLADDPGLGARLSLEQAQSLLPRIALLNGVVTARILEFVQQKPRAETDAMEPLMTVKQLAAFLSQSEDYIYAHCDQWPFTVRTGKSGRGVRFDPVKLRGWLKSATGAVR